MHPPRSRPPSSIALLRRARQVPPEPRFTARLGQSEPRGAETSKLVFQFRAFVLATFAEDLTALADFGLKPRKQGTHKPPVPVAAAAKAKATRAARGTEGKKQKQTIKVAAPSPTTPAGGTTTAK